METCEPRRYNSLQKTLLCYREPEQVSKCQTSHVGLHVNSCVQNQKKQQQPEKFQGYFGLERAAFTDRHPLQLIWVRVRVVASFLQRLSVEDLISPQLISAHRSLKAKSAWLIGVKQVFSFVDTADGPGDSKQEKRLNALTATIKAVEWLTNTH